MGRAAACKTSSPQEALTIAASVCEAGPWVLLARFARLTRLRTASAWQADTRLQARLHNWIAFIAPNRFIYGRTKLKGNLCH